MRTTNFGLGLGALLLLGVATPVWADTVKLKNGSVLEGVQAEFEGDSLRIRRETGSSLIPLDEVASVSPGATRAEVLAAKKLAAGDDPAQLRSVARWCGDNNLTREQKDLLALSRGIELDRKLALLDATTTVVPFLELVRSMRGNEYTDGERRVVLQKALERDADNADVHHELGEVRYQGRWMPASQAATLAAAEEERVMTARGLVRHEGRWMTPAQVASNEAARLADEERARALAQHEADQAAIRAADERARAAEEQARLAEDRRVEAEEAARIQAQRNYENNYNYSYSSGYVYPRVHRIHVEEGCGITTDRQPSIRPAPPVVSVRIVPAPAPRAPAPSYARTVVQQPVGQQPAPSFHR